MNNGGSALRFNEGKTRYDLIPTFAQEQYAKVLTLGARKYTERNWEKGMSWSKVLASLERHLYAIKSGEDFDKETGMLHSAHVMCNAAFLTEYYKIFPQGDDRPLDYTRQKRIGMDIDNVLADFTGPYCRRFDLPVPETWNFHTSFLPHYRELEDHFFENLPSVLHPKDLSFEPVVYITQRGEHRREATERWLFENNKYAVSPVVFVQDKLQACRDFRVDAFVDDNFDTFVHLNKNGVLCYLFDAPHNRKFDVGHKRITRETINRML